MKDNRALPYLEGLMLHQDARVRTEVVHCIAELNGEEAEILMCRCLRDPEKGVRTVAAKKMGQMGQTGGSRAASYLIECILEKPFLKRMFDEKWEFFDALGHAASDETVPVLEKLLRKRSIFHSTETEEMKRCSAATLARLGTPAAVKVLEEHAHKARGEVRKACVEALRLCSRRGNG
jgi:HEAT repeat protein